MMEGAKPRLRFVSVLPVRPSANPSSAARGERMPAVQRQRISGHSPYEPVFGFSRAVVVGDRVLVAGTAPVPPGGGPPPAEAYEIEAEAVLPG